VSTDTSGSVAHQSQSQSPAKKKKKIGRPTHLTPEVLEKVLYAISKGNYRKVAAQYAGVSEKCFKDWMRRGKEEPDGDYGEFFKKVTEEESKVEIEAVGVLSDSNSKDAKRLIEYLSRKHPERWASDSYKVKQLEKELQEIKRLLNEHVLRSGREAKEEAGETVKLAV
jgi:hypothetical protein